MEMAGKKDGTILGLKSVVRANVGAYLSTFAPLIPTYAFGLLLGGLYKLPNIYCKVFGVYTNTGLVDAYRGAGRPEAIYMLERMIDRFAAEIGKDPVQVRRKNFIPPFKNGYTTTTGVVYDSGNYKGLMDKLIEMVGYKSFRQEQKESRKSGKYLGVGFSTYVELYFYLCLSVQQRIVLK